MQGCRDDTFGPTTIASHGCRFGLDFTLLFQGAILVVAPCSVFIICALIEIAWIYRKTPILDWCWIETSLRIRLVVATLLIATQILQLVLWTLTSLGGTNLNVTAAAIELFSSLVICGLVSVRHIHSPRPSTLLSLFLSLRLLFAVVQIRTLALIRTVPGLLATAAVVVCLELVLLVVENWKIQVSSLCRKHRPDHATGQATGILADSFMLWLLPLFQIGYSKNVKSTHLPDLLASLRTGTVATESAELWRKARHDRKHALALTTFRLARQSLLLQMVPRLCLLGFTMAQPFLIERFITDISTNANSGAFLFVAAFALVYIGIAVSTNWYQVLTVRTITKMRGGLISLIYEKSLQLSINDLDDSTAVSLITADTERISTAIEYVQNLWVDLIQIGLATYILSIYVSTVSVAAVLVSLISSIAAGQLGRLIGPRQRAWFDAGRERIKFTTTMLNNIKDLKWSGLESEVNAIVSSLRLNQISAQKRFRHVQIWMIFLGNFPSLVTPFVVFLSFAIASFLSSGPPLSLAEAFAALSVLSLLIAPVSDIIGIVPNLAASLDCFSSIQDYLLKSVKLNVASSVVSPMEGIEQTHETDSSYACYRGLNIAIREADDFKTVLTNVNFTIPIGQLTMISGATGCGKTILMRSLFDETTCTGGYRFVRPGMIGYYAQSTWALHATIKENIVGPSPVDDIWYSKVLWACGLSEELQILPDGDQTIIGSKAGSLSGGQSARVSLARTVYSKAPVILLDEPFASLDAKTEDECFRRLFGPSGLLSRGNTTVVMASISKKWLTHADYTIIFQDHGHVLSHARAKTPEMEAIQSVDKGFILEKPATWEKSGDEKANIPGSANESISLHLPDDDTTTSSVIRIKDLGVAIHYLKTMHLWIFIALLLMMLAQVALIAIQPLWLNLWIVYNTIYPNQSTGYYFGIYFIFVSGGLLFLFICACIFFLVLVPRSSQALHEQMLDATLHAPLAFFQKAEIGAILNYFTQDLVLVDGALPLALLLALENGMSSIGQLILVSISTGYVALAIPGLLLALYLIQQSYLRTSKQVRLIDLAAKAPIYTHLTQTISGIDTIRLLSWQNYCLSKSYSIVDDSQSAYYVMLCIQKWLALVLNLLVAGLAITLSTTIIALQGQISPNLLGVSLVSIVGLGEKLSYFVTFWTTLETSLGSVARIRSYSNDTPRLDTSTQFIMSLDWPRSGNVEFCGLFAGHSGKTVLHDITCSIPCGQKVRIYGKSGSGKSSMAASLLRLIDVHAGSVLIDGQDLSSVSMRSIHQAIFALPQTLCFVSATIRSNLCCRVHDDVADADVERVLRLVSLWDRISSLPDGLGTSWTMELFSPGQRQLFGFAQALLSQSPIIIVDEISSFLDNEAILIIQNLLSTEFHNRTVLMITHDSREGFNFDRHIQIEAGKIVRDYAA